MAKYKDMTVPSKLVDVIEHMKDVDSYREELTILGQAWDLLTILGRMSGGRTDMTSTREDFRQLTEKLITSLGHETLSKTVLDITAKAQVAVDIIIRNLFERTADIGFLATDDDTRDFIRKRRNEIKAGVESDTNASAAIVQRFQEYVAKYSVYHNIILLDTEGNVLVQLDDTNPVKHSADPIIRQALTTREDYVESFHKTDLLPEESDSLLYAFRVTETNSPDSEPLGVLCLCFRFENEMEGIFRNLSGLDDWSVVTLLDEKGRVIASSSPYQVPVNAHVDMVCEEEFRITKFGGRRYLAKTTETKGYQGFFGLGWKGHAMIPLDVAFENSGEHILKDVNQDILQSILNNPQIFSEEIQNIPIKAEHIQNELDRTVWNGNISSENREGADSASASKVLLWEISRTGNKTKNVFARAIQNLHETIVSTYMNDVEFLASLAIDIMDRNLYERANDCRWWALTSEFRRILNLPKITEKEAAKAEEILVYINNLYTVYTNLVLYNRAGKVIAVSNPAESALVGKSLGESWVETALKIRNTQEYCVSDFVPSPLYQNKPTYIYNAAINAPDNPSLAVGGIGIVFDSEPEFEAMLMDALPRDTDGQLVNGAFAAFVDQRGMVISATRPDIMVGDRIDIDTTLLNANHDGSRSAIFELNGVYYAVGIRVSNGYREYKSEQDKYKNVVFALVFMELDKVREVDSSDKGFPSAEVESDNSLHRTLTENYIEVATFYIDNHWYGVDVNEVVEAIKYENIQTIPCASEHIAGTYYYNGEVIVILDPSKVLGYSDKRDPSQQQIIVFNTPRGRFGLIVDYLGKIPRINKDLLEHKNALLDQAGSLIECIVKPDTSGDDTQPMLIILNTGEVYQSLSQGADVELDEMQALTWAEAEA